ncbi:MAG: ABC transporter transmembrane domain-containing protein [Blastocatellia bacterium]
MTTTQDNSTKGIGQELASIVRQTLQVWKLISRRHRFGLITATVAMGIGAWFNARIPIVLGNLATGMELAKNNGSSWEVGRAKPFLISLALFFLFREGLKVMSKYLIHFTCTRVEKDTSVGLVSHLLQVDLATLSQERVGTLHGRIRRSIEGFVKLLKLSFIDFIPAFLTVAFALGVAMHRKMALGLLMSGIVPIAMFIVMRQIGSQKGIRLELHRSKDSVDGTVVEQLGGIEYVRAADTHRQEVARA